VSACCAELRLSRPVIAAPIKDFGGYNKKSLRGMVSMTILNRHTRTRRLNPKWFGDYG
jgi:hypothetical protein